MKSKTPIVRKLLVFRPFITRIWILFPSIISRIFLSLFKFGNSKIAFIIRYLCIYKLSKKCGEKVIIFPGVYFKHLDKLSLGTNVSIHELCYIDAFGEIEIMDNVAISHNVSILSFDHDFEKNLHNYKDAPAISEKCVIENNVWIGAGARILKGVIIRENCIIASGAVVNRETQNNMIYGGVPAKPIKPI